jgi:hypothetical protein
MVRLTVPEAAQYVRCHRNTLAKLRVYGGGPVYSKSFGRILYDTTDLDRWLDAGKRTSTSDRPRRRRGRPRRAA